VAASRRAACNSSRADEHQPVQVGSGEKGHGLYLSNVHSTVILNGSALPP